MGLFWSLLWDWHDLSLIAAITLMKPSKTYLITAATGLALAFAPAARALQLAVNTGTGSVNLTLGKDITTNDGNNGLAGADATHGGTGNADTRTALPYGASSGSKIAVREDQEVEAYNPPLSNYNAIWDQSWDLEGAFWNANLSRLSIVGGFDFATGNNNQYRSGDMMIDITPFSSTINAYQASINYVVHFNWNDSFNNWSSLGAGVNALNVSFDVYRLGNGDDGSFQNTVYFGTSNPWRYTPGTNETKLDSGVATIAKFSTFVGGNLTTDEGYTLQGAGDRYALMIGGSTAVDNAGAFGIGAILADANVTEFGANFTMRCGNDEITAWNPNSNQVFVPDSGATLILLGVSLLGMSLIRRKA